MAKRELSSTLKNLKFMQRAAVREDDKCEKEEEVIPDGNFPSSGTFKKCTVILEGDPHPGALKGRMSFQNFNPSINKLNEEGTSPRQSEASTPSSVSQNGSAPNRGHASTKNELENRKVDTSNNDANGELKRKQPEVGSPHTLQKKVQGDQEASPSGSSSSRPSDSRSSHKQQKREKLDWSVLRPPKDQSKRSDY